MELESIASDLDGETPDADDDDGATDGGYASGDDEPKTPAGIGHATNDDDDGGAGGNDESFDEFATPTARLGFTSAPSADGGIARLCQRGELAGTSDGSPSRR